MLKFSDIDVILFKAHSVRDASTSALCSRRANLSEILKMDDLHEINIIVICIVDVLNKRTSLLHSSDIYGSGALKSQV